MKKIISIILIISCYSILGQMPNTLSNSDKLYGLSKLWQEVNYNFIYLNKVDKKKWNNDYRKLLTEVQETKNDYEYYRLLKKFCASLNDGHTNVYMPKEIRSKLFTTHFGEYRLFLKNIGGKAIVTRTNASKQDEIPIGSEIISVNGLTTKEYLNKKVKPFISSSTDYILDDWGTYWLLKGPEGSTYDLEIKLPSGVIKPLKLTHTKTEEEEVYPPFDEKEIFEFKWINDEIAYISLNTFGNRKIDTLFIEKLPELYKAKNLIVDLRKNGGGSTSIGREILQYLTTDTLLYGSRYYSRMHIPSYKAWGKWVEEADTAGNDWARKSFLSYRNEYYYDFEYEPFSVSLDEKRLVVPTALLIGHYTASAAEDFLIYADNQEHMTKIGEPTFGSTGQPMVFDLPGGGSARVCTKKDTYPDGREFVGYGVQPDLVVKKSLEDYLNDRDPVLEKAIEYLENKN